MRAALVVTLCVISLISVGAASKDLRWNLYKSRHGKSYSDPREDAMRRSIFLETKRKVEQHNAQAASHSQGLNQFSDWTADELSRLRGAKISAEKLEEIRRHELSTDDQLGRQLLADGDDIPDELDWRQVPDRVTEVIDQGKGCVADYAFATTGVLEGQMIRANYSHVALLSAQQLIDCPKRRESCDTGGLVSDALSDIIDQAGIEREVDYPYQGIFIRCRFDVGPAIFSQLSGYKALKQDEETIKQVVAKIGPVAAAIDPVNLEAYKSGIISENHDCKQDAQHATKPVLIVGYGKDKSLGDYWIIKNSWGKNWGEEGYFRLAMHKNLCGISQLAIIPTSTRW